MAGVQFLSGARDFSLFHGIHTSSEAHPVSYLMGTRAFSLRVKWKGHEADHSPPFSGRVKNGGAIPPLPDMSSWHST
jgi:hypothetical protein